MCYQVVMANTQRAARIPVETAIERKTQTKRGGEGADIAGQLSFSYSYQSGNCGAKHMSKRGWMCLLSSIGTITIK